MDILIIGSGGREHALARKLKGSAHCNRLFIAPGNAGTDSCGENVPIDGNDFEGLADFVKKHQIGMVVVGPEEPLVKGLSDHFQADEDLSDVLFVGPGASGARLEGSKAFAKEFMMKHEIPTASFAAFTRDTLDKGKDFLRSLSPPYVLKADGLAAGKGVLICESLEEALIQLEDMLAGERFGRASEVVVVEEFLRGREVSVFVITDGKDYKILPSAKDYKRIGEADSGPNTGGMGAVSPVPFAGKAFIEKVESRIIIPTIEGLKSEGIDYKGFIFFGLMDVDGDPYVIEYNVRLGDPEAEVVLPRISSDLFEMLEATAKGQLKDISLKTDPRTAVTVVLASGGYPGGFTKGYPISLTNMSNDDLLFFSGMTRQGEDLLTAGGRVMAVTAMGEDIEQAREAAYEKVGLIDFKGKYFRRDIGRDLLD
jgi:phosphoribosylamine---glycine ligase